MNSKLTKDSIKLLKSSLPYKRSGNLEILRKVAVFFGEDRTVPVYAKEIK